MNSGRNVAAGDQESSGDTIETQEHAGQGPVMWMFKRPALLWAFTLYFLYSTVFEISRTYGIWAGNFGEELRSSYDGLTAVDWIVWGVLTILTLTATATLFFLKRIAVVLFIFILAINVLSFVFQVTMGSGSAVGDLGGVGVVMGFGVYILICVYAVSLRVNGVLK